MSDTRNLVLEDRVLSVKAWFYDLIGNGRAQRAALEQQLEVRCLRLPVDHLSFVDVYEALALNYRGYAPGDLLKADELAKEALRICLLHCQGGKPNFRAGKIIHLRSQIHQGLNHNIVALELGEDALAIYNNTKLVCTQRAMLLHALIYLHNQVGSPERADQLAIESRSLDSVLSASAARGRF